MTDVVLQAITKALGIYANRKVGYRPDWDKKYKLIKDWQGNEWNDFVRDFLVQAAK